MVTTNRSKADIVASLKTFSVGDAKDLKAWVNSRSLLSHAPHADLLPFNVLLLLMPLPSNLEKTGPVPSVAFTPFQAVTVFHSLLGKVKDQRV